MDSHHAHPTSSPANTIHARSRSVNTIAWRDSGTPATPNSAPPTRQQRILRTRHARFSAQNLSINGIGLPYTQLTRTNENETKGNNSSGRKIELHNPSPTSTILNEITNSSVYRHRSLQNRPPIPVFQDTAQTSFTDIVATNSPAFHRNASGVVHTRVLDSADSLTIDMGLREVSPNIQRTSSGPGSPYYLSVRTGSRHKSAIANPASIQKSTSNTLKMSWNGPKTRFTPQPPTFLGRRSLERQQRRTND